MNFIVKNIKDEIKNTLSWLKSPKNILRLGIMAVVIVLLIITAVWANTPDEDSVPTAMSKMVFEKAVVTNVLSDDAQQDYENAEGRRIGTQKLEIKILSGTHKDEIMHLTNYLGVIFNVDVQKGDKIIVRLFTDENNQYYPTMFNHNRGLVLGSFIAIFFIALSIAGGRKGISATIGLIFTLLCIWFILIPCMIKGLPTILITVIITSITAAGALILMNGFSSKTLCAVLGCTFGVITAGALAYIVSLITPLNGFNMSEAENLILYGADKGLKISGLLVCGVIISTLGAVMDVSVGIVSAMWEIKEQNKDITAKELFRSGYNVGKDAMGTMANTLILAFAGSGLNMLILVQTYEIPFLQLVNTDYICLEVIQSICASMGILFSVFITAILSSRIMTHGVNNK